MQLDGRPPAHDLDAEAATLSTPILDPESLDLIREILGPEAEDHKNEVFYSDANGKIYEALCKLSDAEQKIDSVTVASWLRDRGWLTDVGGYAYVAQIVDATPSLSNVDEHAQKVRDLSDLRAFQREAGRTYALASADVGPDIQAFMTDRMLALGKIVDKREVDDGIMLGDLMARRFKAIANPEQHDTSVCVYSGIAPLDRRMGPLRGGNMFLIAAQSGVGKTSLATNMAVKIAGANSYVCASCKSNVVGHECELCGSSETREIRNCVAIFSLEMTEDEMHDRIVFSESRAKAPYTDQYGRTHLPAGSAEKVAANANALAMLPIKIYDNVFDMVRIRLRCLTVKRKAEKAGNRLAAVVIDYLQLAHPGGPEQRKSSNREQEVAAVSRMAKKLAKELDAVVILLAQLNDDPRKEKRKPTMEDIRESKAPSKDASKVVLIYNQAMEERVHEYIDAGDASDQRSDAGLVDCVDLIIAKCRGGGRTGIVRVAFYPEYTLFDTWPDGVPMPDLSRGDTNDGEEKRGRRR